MEDDPVMKEFSVKKMTAEDVPQVTALEQRAFSEPWSEKGFSDALLQERNVFLVARSTDGRIVGYCGMYGVADEGEITNVAVEETYRRRGIAASLLLRLKEYARQDGIAAVFLEVRRSNEAAVRLYEKSGFAVCGIRKAFYRRPVEDALTMRCSIMIPGSTGNDKDILS